MPDPIELLNPIVNNPDGLYSAAAVANYLGRSKITLRRYRKLGIGPKFSRIPNPDTGRPVYRGRDVLSWLEDSQT